MFEDFAKYVGVKRPPNRFWPVEAGDISKNERKLGFKFPSELRTFFIEVGCGFLCQGVKEKKRDPGLINGILGPLEIADILLNPGCPARPDEGFLDGLMPFFDVGENTYLVMVPESRSPNRVYWPDGNTLVSESFQEFAADLYQEAGFYRKRRRI